MKKFALVCIASVALIGCSSKPKKVDTPTPSASVPPAAKVEAPPTTAIVNQKLSTSFNKQGIKIEWDCSMLDNVKNSGCENADIKSIEVIAYATSNGNTENNRLDAFKVAELRAKAKLRHFIYEEVQSSRTVTTISKNIEKANDRIKNRITNTEEVSMSDDEANKDTNWAIRENNNNIARNIVETIKTNAQGILRGVYITDESVLEKQTVSITIRWDKNSNRASNILRSTFGN